MVSWYEHCRKVKFAPNTGYFKANRIPDPQMACEKALTLDYKHWLRWIYQHRKAGRLCGAFSFGPCASWNYQTTKATRSNAGQEDTAGSFLVDFVIRFEHLHDDFERLLDILEMLGYFTWPNVRPRDPLPRINASVRNKTTIEYYSSEESRRWIEKEHALDLKLFGYKLE